MTDAWNDVRNTRSVYGHIVEWDAQGISVTLSLSLVLGSAVLLGARLLRQENQHSSLVTGPRRMHYDAEVLYGAFGCGLGEEG